MSQSTLGWGGRRGTQGAFPHPSWDGSEGGEEVIHMSSGVTYVTISEVHFFFVNGPLTHLALVSSEGGLAREKGRDGTGTGETEGFCLRSWD